MDKELLAGPVLSHYRIMSKRLEKHMVARAETANTYAVAPELDDLRFEPRFKEMLKRMSLPE